MVKMKAKVMNAPADQILTRERVSGDDRHRHVEDRAEEGIEKRIGEAVPNLLVLEDGLVSQQAEIDGPQGDPAGDHRFGRTERGGDNEYQVAAG